MKIRILLTLLSYFAYLHCRAQQVTFKESLGGNLPDYGYSVIQAYDKGYVAAGSTASFSYGNSDVYVIKTDSNGTLKWSKHFGSPNIEVGRCVEELKDSSLIIVGFTNNVNANGYDVYLLHLDSQGDSLWAKTYGGTGWDFAYAVHQTIDGGFIIAGGTYSYGSGGEDCWLIKTDISGDTLWTKTYGGDMDDEARSVRQTSDSGFVLTGTTKSFGDTSGDVYIVKTTKTGDTLWTRTYGRKFEEDGTDIIECKNHDFAVCGRAYDDSGLKTASTYLLRTQNNGQYKWSVYYYNDTVHYSSLESIIEIPNGNLFSAGITDKYGQGAKDGFLLITTDVGQFINGYTYGTAEDDGWYSVTPTKDKGYIFCGYTDSTNLGFGEQNLCIQKTDSNGLTPFIPFLLSTHTFKSNALYVNIYPNPFNTNTHILINSVDKISPSNFSLKTMDITGRNCSANYRIVSANNNSIELQLNRNDLQQGIYFIQFYQNSQQVGTSKVIIE